MLPDGLILTRQRFPSPHPEIDLYLITYTCQGLKIKGLLAEPKGVGIYDGFLYLRGGIKNVGKVRVGRIIQFASEGFIVLAPFYRGNQGGEGNEDFAGEDRFDTVGSFRVLESHPRVRSDRIHVFGFSRGGVMALFAGILNPHVKSIVTWGGISDLALTYVERNDLRRMMKRVIGGTPLKYPEKYKWRTPLYELEKVKANILIIHGEKDQNVTIEHAYRLEKRLKELGKKATSWYFKDYTHYFPPKENRNTVKRLTEWMKNN